MEAQREKKKLKRFDPATQEQDRKPTKKILTTIVEPQNQIC
jgi:hypothetical protein